MELFKILPNGKVEYDFDKFLTFDDVIIAEWEQNDPELTRESLSKILERIWDKKSYCTNGKGKVKENTGSRILIVLLNTVKLRRNIYVLAKY
jgi:hypothetical protein